MCRTPENAIFKSQKLGKMGKYGGNQKTQFKICGNWKNFQKLRKAEKTQKDNEKVRKPKKKKSHGKPEKVDISI